MKNTTEVPNALIISAHKEACVKWKGIIEKACPLLFPKVEYKIGQWGWVDDKIENYNNGIKWIGRVDQIDDNGNIWLIEHSVSGHYSSENGYRRICISSGASLTLATPSEVESHLIKVAEEKGFKEGVTVIGEGFDIPVKLCSKKWGGYDYYEGSLWYGTDQRSGSIKLFDNETDKWATIIPSPLEVTLEEVAKKFGVSEVKIKQ